MKKFLAAGMMLAVVVLPATATAQRVPHTRPGCAKTFTVPMVKRAIYWTYRGSRVVPRKERRMVARIVRCERWPNSRAYVRKIAHAVIARWKVRRYDDEITPYGIWAIPWYVVSCESHGQNLPPNSAGASGYYQIVPGTWAAYGGYRFASQAYESSKLGQDVIAGRIWAGGAGSSQWVCA